MEKLWFLFCDGAVTGPHSTDDLAHENPNKSWPKGTMVWWKGHSDWVPIDVWQQHLPELLTTLQQRTNQNEQWYLFDGQNQIGPMDQPHLIRHLTQHPNIAMVRIWNESFEDWKPIFEVDQIMSTAGIVPRRHIRIPMIGSAFAQTEMDSKNFDIYSISEGGIGLNNAKDLVLNQKVQLTIKSPMLVSPIRAIAHVVFCDSTGKVGLQFDGLNVESKSIILDYVRSTQAHAGNLTAEGFDEDSVITRVTDELPEAIDSTLWFINRMGVEQGPLKKPELLGILANLEDKSIVRISNSQTKDWRGPFDFKEVVQALGLKSRENLRAPIVGELVITHENRKYFLDVTSVSKDGVGVRGEIQYIPSSVFTAEFNAKIFSTKIPVKIQFVYGPNHEVRGAVFQNIEETAVTEINRYIHLLGVQQKEALGIPLLLSA